MLDQTLIAYDSETVIIAFTNSSGFLEYTTYTAIDGGDLPLLSTPQTTFQRLLDSEDIIGDIEEITDVRST